VQQRKKETQLEREREKLFSVHGKILFWKIQIPSATWLLSFDRRHYIELRYFLKEENVLKIENTPPYESVLLLLSLSHEYSLASHFFVATALLRCFL
jgi:hypothetical protein